MYRCEYCLSSRFMTKENLFKHINTCSTSYINCFEKLPEEGKIFLQFKNYCNQFQHPFNVVADFESTLLKIFDVEPSIFLMKNLQPTSSLSEFDEDEEANIKYTTKILYSSNEKHKDVVSLLLFEKDDKQHYVWIKDINKLDKSNVATNV